MASHRHITRAALCVAPGLWVQFATAQQATCSVKPLTRDRFAGAHTAEVATRKAWTVGAPLQLTRYR